MKHANSFADYTTDELKGILLLAEKIKQHQDDYGHILDGKKLYTLFEKTSNRTYLSFSIGMEELGGKAYNQLWKDSGLSFDHWDIQSKAKLLDENGEEYDYAAWADSYVFGAGMAGVACASELADHDVDVTLFDRHDYTQFQPLLYQVATGVLSEGEIAPPTREILRNQRNARVLLGLVDDIDVKKVLDFEHGLHQFLKTSHAALLEKLEKDKAISEDEQKKASEDVQKLTDKFVAEADKKCAAKEKEIMEI